MASARSVLPGSEPDLLYRASCPACNTLSGEIPVWAGLEMLHDDHGAGLVEYLDHTALVVCPAGHPTNFAPVLLDKSVKSM